MLRLLLETVEQLYLLAVDQLYNPMKLPLEPNRDVARSLVVVEETCMISHKDFSSLQFHNFWNTISWKCSLKDDCIRSSLIECQSFSNRKIHINPKYRVLMFLPSTMQVLCTTWFVEVNLCKILMPFVSGINRQKEYCLSLA